MSMSKAGHPHRFGEVDTSIVCVCICYLRPSVFLTKFENILKMQPGFINSKVMSLRILGFRGTPKPQRCPRSVAEL